jgi:hypothetical protein
MAVYARTGRGWDSCDVTAVHSPRSEGSAAPASVPASPHLAGTVTVRLHRSDKEHDLRGAPGAVEQRSAVPPYIHTVSRESPALPATADAATVCPWRPCGPLPAGNCTTSQRQDAAAPAEQGALADDNSSSTSSVSSSTWFPLPAAVGAGGGGGGAETQAAQ